MSSAASISFHHRKPFLALAAALLAALFALLLARSAHADSPQITLSTGTTNPGGEVIITGSGWAPAKTYNLYVYNQKACNGQTTCAPPSGTTPINKADGPEKINSDGTFSFDFTFSAKAGAITYVFTVVAVETSASASVPEQVLPAGTPPSGTPVSSSPVAVSPTTNPTNAATTTTATHTSQGGGTTTGGQTPTTNTGGSGTTNILIVVVLILLLLMIGVLVVLLRILPPKRRAIRAAYYGSGPAATPGRVTGGQHRQPSGAYYRSDEQMPWQGGVASWGEGEPRTPRGSRPTAPRPPRRPGDNSGPRR